MADNRCVCCGEIIPEGMIACPVCFDVSQKKEKRLIDANALKQHLLLCGLQLNASTLGFVNKRIDEQPTVDAVEVPPVKIGDTVYCVIGGKIFEAEVYFIRWEQHKQYGIHSDIQATIVPNYSVGGSFDDFGKTVFLSKEEAEVALAKMQGGEKSGK